MARLIVTFNKQIVKQIPFGKMGSLTIGRKAVNDICIDNLSVSGHHARVDKAGSDFILTDLQSTNGTYVNNKKIISHKLTHGDNVQIGKHIILFLDSDEKNKDASKPLTEDDIDKTMILETAKHREMVAGQEMPASGRQPEKTGVLSFLDSSGLGEVELNKKLSRIGKSSNCEIRLSGMMIGSTAATISKRPGGYTLSFTGGRAKLKVNGEVVKESRTLKDFDTIELGGYRFQFYEKEAAAK